MCIAVPIRSGRPDAEHLKRATKDSSRHRVGLASGVLFRGLLQLGSHEICKTIQQPFRHFAGLRMIVTATEFPVVGMATFSAASDLRRSSATPTVLQTPRADIGRQ